MNILDLKNKLLDLKSIINDNQNFMSNHDRFRVYLYNAYLLLKDLNLNPKVIKILPKTIKDTKGCWIELRGTLGNTYVVDLAWSNPIQLKKDTYLESFGDDVDSIISIEEFMANNKDLNVEKTKRWPKFMRPHKVHSSPPPMSKKPTKPRPPPQHAPTIRRHKKI